MMSHELLLSCLHHSRKTSLFSAMRSGGYRILLYHLGLFLFVVHYVSRCLCLATTYSTPWHLDRLDQHAGVDYLPFHGNVAARTRPVLYVIDSGIDEHHTEFTSGLSRVINGYNFAEESWDSTDCMGHGTHVAGLAAGHKYGVAGSIGVDIVSVRILDCQGRGSCSSLIRALEWYVCPSAALCDTPYPFPCSWFLQISFRCGQTDTDKENTTQGTSKPHLPKIQSARRGCYEHRKPKS